MTNIIRVSYSLQKFLQYMGNEENINLIVKQQQQKNPYVNEFIF